MKAPPRLSVYPWKPCLRLRKCWRFQSLNCLKIKKSHGETSFRQELRLTVRFILCPVIQWTSNGGKALQTGDHHIILAERTVDDEQVSAFISATHDSHMLITRIEYQITGLGLIPRDGGTFVPACITAKFLPRNMTRWFKRLPAVQALQYSLFFTHDLSAPLTFYSHLTTGGKVLRYFTLTCISISAGAQFFPLKRLKPLPQQGFQGLHLFQQP